MTVREVCGYGRRSSRESEFGTNELSAILMNSKAFDCPWVIFRESRMIFPSQASATIKEVVLKYRHVLAWLWMRACLVLPAFLSSVAWMRWSLCYPLGTSLLFRTDFILVDAERGWHSLYALLCIVSRQLRWCARPIAVDYYDCQEPGYQFFTRWMQVWSPRDLLREGTEPRTIVSSLR